MSAASIAPVVLELLAEALRLFQAGQREEALEKFEEASRRQALIESRRARSKGKKKK